MLIFSIDNEVFIHRKRVISGGRVLVINNRSEIVQELDLPDDNFFSFQVGLPEGKYLVRVISTEEKVEKSVLIKRSGNSNTKDSR